MSGSPITVQRRAIAAPGVCTAPRAISGHVEMFTLWDDLNAIRRFASTELTKAKYFDLDPDFLLELEPEVTHFEVIEGCFSALLAVAVEIENGRFFLGLQQAQPARDFLIGFLDAAKVLSEAVLVELLAGLDVPQAAAVRADFVGQDHAREVAVPDAAELQLEVDQRMPIAANMPDRKSFTRIAMSAMSFISSWVAQPKQAICSSAIIGSPSASSL